MNKYDFYEKKRDEYLEVNNKERIKHYEKLMRLEESNKFDKEYYENRIKHLIKFIKIKGLYADWLLYFEDNVKLK